MKIIPAIDLMEGQVVRLYQGKPENKTVYSNDPQDVSKKWEKAGADMLHLVDLDATLQRGSNLKLIEKIIKEISIPVQVAGGLRAEPIILEALDFAQRVVLGTIAFKDMELVSKLAAKFGANRIVISADHNNGMIVINGWQQPTSINLIGAMQNFVGKNFSEFLITNILQDGTMKGPDLKYLKKACEFSNAQIIASGGISNLDDITAVKKCNAYGVILGKALYEGKVSIEEAKKSGMTLTKRIIPCLDVANGRVVKGLHFESIKDAGDPVLLAEKYSKEGADELVFLDITASQEQRETIRSLVSKVAQVIDIPFTVGGGVKTLQHARDILLCGADKVAINTGAVKNPHIITELMSLFGKQCIVVAIDAKRNYDHTQGKNIFSDNSKKFWFEVFIYGGKKETGIDAIEWAKKVQQLGAGEILLTSIDKDGTKDGYDIILTKAIVKAASTPVIASGGCGEPLHMLDVFKKTDVDAALAASIFHYETHSVDRVKEYLKENNVQVRL